MSLFNIKNILLIGLLSVLAAAGQQDFEFQINIDALRNHAEYLADDELRGRGTGTYGEKLAAEYLAMEFERLNLFPLGDNGNYFQNIPMHSSESLSGCQALLYNNTDTLNLELEKDYLLFKSGAQTLVPKPIDLVFVGYGIFAPEYDYNDYQSVDVSNKIVVYLDGEPVSTDKSYFNGTEQTIYAYPESKERMAISRGARGSILLLNPQNPRFRTWEHYVQNYAFTEVTLAYSVTAHLSLILNPNSAAHLFKNAQYSLQDIYTMDKNNTLKSFDLATSLSFKGQFKQRDFISPNVIAMLSGSDSKLKHEYIIITAHYDHLGIGKPMLADSIYNGFGDNALGCAGVLEMARVLSENRKKLKRSFIFLMVTGEEKGLLGSTYYIDHPAVPLYRTIANLNVDGLAMFDEFNDIVGVGHELSDLDETLKETANQLGLLTSPVPQQFMVSESFARSDQISFAKAGIPSILIMDGLQYKRLTPVQGLQMHINWIDHIYHTPFDDKDQTMNYKAAQQHCRVLTHFIFNTANRESEPQWKPGTPYINARLQTIAEKR